MQRIVRISLTAAVGVLLYACATSPTGRSQLILVSDAEMNAMGIQAFQQMQQETPVMRNTPQSRYVQCISDAILRVVSPDGDWEVQTFDSEMVNAFALPGGKIGVYTGLIKVAETPDQLAAVIGHEIAHVHARHSAARVSNQLVAQLGIAVLAGSTGYNPELIGMGANLLLMLPNGRRDESEADMLGLEYMARAGFNPAAAADLWVNMARASSGEAPPEFLSTHPAHDTRIRDIERALPSVMPLFEQARANGLRPNCPRPR